MQNRSTWRGRSGPARAGVVAFGAAFLAACSSTQAPPRAASAGPALHAREAPLPRDIEANTQTVLAALNRPALEGLSFKAVQAGRAKIGETAGPAQGAHETAFAGPADDLKTANLTGDSATPESILAQNSFADNGGWREQEDAFVHAHSGMRCPKTLTMLLIEEDGEPTRADASLARIQLFNERSDDTACHFENRETGISLTLYASNWPDISLEEHFGAGLKLIVDKFPLKSEVPVIVANSETEKPATSTIEGDTWAAAFLTEPMNGETFKTALWLNKTGPWHVKARATFPVAPDSGEAAFSAAELASATMHAITLSEVDRHINTAAQTVSYER